jgi:NAD-dependent dihydropyrimidine dehydrogenase PreA subunit
MTALFINVEVAPEVANDPELAKKLEEVCPVDIFKAADGHLEIVEENLDECVLCQLCINATPPGSVKVIKLYDAGAVLGA